MKKLLLIIIAVFSLNVAFGQVIASWKLDDTANGTPNVTAAHMSAGNFTGGSGIGALNFSSNGAYADSWTIGETIDANDYFQVTVTADDGYTIHVTDINFDERRSNSGINDYQVEYSFNSDFSSSTILVTVNDLPDNDSSRSGDISGLDIYVPQNESLYIRWFGYDSEQNTGTWRIEDSTLEILGNVITLDEDVYANDDYSTQPSDAEIKTVYNTSSDAVSAFKFYIFDDGTNDGLPTKVKTIKLKPYITGSSDTGNNINWEDSILDFVIYKGASSTGLAHTTIVTNDYVEFTFDKDVLDVPNDTDGNGLELTFKVYLKPNISVIDKESRLAFMVDAEDHGFTAYGDGSQFTADLGDDFNSNDFTIDVDTTELQFLQQPSSVEVGATMTPPVEVAYTDAYGNIDKDSDVETTSTMTATGSIISGTISEISPINGILTFSDLAFSNVANNVTLTITDDYDDPEVTITSNPFNVTLVTAECSQLFISEYGHFWDGIGTGANYIEIYNPSAKDIDLTDYQFVINFSNGSTATIALSGTLTTGGVYVVSDDQGNVAGADQTEADLNYSGDDTILFQYNGSTIDVIGDGTDPGTGWTVAGIADATNNNTLIRTKTTNKPNTDWASSAAGEWIVSDYTQANLFFHNSNCNYYPCSATEQTALLLDFETAGGYTTSETEFNDDNYHYFKRDTESNLGSYVTLNNLQGSYMFAVQDTDGTADPIYLTIDPIDISNLENLKFSIMIAEDDNGSNENWDANTNMHIKYSIDNTNYDQNLLWVEATAGDDSKPGVDPNFNGVGNSNYEVTADFKEFTKDILGSGTTLYIKITFSDLDDVAQDIAIDNIKVTGDKIPTSTFASGAWDNVPNIGMKAVITENYDTDSAVNGNITSCRCQVNSGATLTVSPNSYMLSAGTITNNGNIVVANQGSVVQIDNKASVITGSGATYKTSVVTTSMDDPRYTYFSSPTNGDTLDIFSSWAATTAMYTWDGDNDAWLAVASTDNMIPGKGYIVRPKNDGSIAFPNTFNTDFIGAFNNGIITHPLYAVNSGDGDNAALVGNPYPSAIDAHALLVANPGASTLYFWSHSISDSDDWSTEDYQELNLGGTTNGAPATISTGQGFFVGAAAAGTFTFDNKLRLTDRNDTFRNNATESELDKVWINVLANTNSRSQILVGFNPICSDAYDYQYDAKRLDADNTTLSLSSVGSDADTAKLAIQTRGELIDGTIVPLTVNVIDDSINSIAISIDHFENLVDWNVFIKDNLLNTQSNLNNGNYNFTVSNTGLLEGRFELVFNKSTLGVQNNTISTDLIVAQNNNGFDLSTTDGTKIKSAMLFNTLGQQLGFYKASNGEIHIPTTNVNIGTVLFINVTLENGTVLNKKAIKL